MNPKEEAEYRSVIARLRTSTDRITQLETELQTLKEQKHTKIERQNRYLKAQLTRAKNERAAAVNSARFLHGQLVVTEGFAQRFPQGIPHIPNAQINANPHG